MTAPPFPQMPATIGESVTHEVVIKKSRFIAQLVPVSTAQEAETEIAAIRRRYWDARHNCTAVILGIWADSQRSSDDGEPSGTAGIPMLQVLRQRNVTDLVAVVTRYFGGIKLGAGGLVRAYSGAVAEALDRARTLPRVLATEVTITVPHADAGRLHGVLAKWCLAHGAVIEDVAYAAQATFALLVPSPDLDALDAAVAESSGGAVRPVRGQTRVMTVR